ncbi:flagellar FlbD family protein [Nocardioides sp. Bht2]|uniref:flagellar FlbD family protein n=1 Tax=Nocardioides sp. Bht2 TaxID=3392297 RepID=UPI0039B37A3E
MITLTRLSGSQFVLNSDLIERVDATPDTVITLVDGKKYVVAERPSTIVNLVREHRGWVVAMSNMLQEEAPAEEPHLAPVSSLPVEHNQEA